MRHTDDLAYKFWRNMMNRKFYKKGEFDSATKGRVLASRGKVFGPETCYFDFIKNLPVGTFYVDGE